MQLQTEPNMFLSHSLCCFCGLASVFVFFGGDAILPTMKLYPKLTVRTWKWMVERWVSFWGARPIFRGELLVSGRVSVPSSFNQKTPVEKRFLLRVKYFTSVVNHHKGPVTKRTYPKSQPSTFGWLKDLFLWSKNWSQPNVDILPLPVQEKQAFILKNTMLSSRMYFLGVVT